MLIAKAMRLAARGSCSPGGLLGEAFPISGQIDPKTFPFLLMNLHRQGATGSFKVEGPTYQKALYFRAGRILFGSSNDPRDQLGAILIENGKISPEQLEDVNSKVGPGSPLAKVLAETGFVNQRELSEAARTKVERILSDIVGYTSGSFEFEDGVLPKGAVDLKLSTERLVLAAVRRIQDRNFVLRHLSGLGEVLLPALQNDEKLDEIQADSAGLIEELDGVATLKEAAERARLDEFEAAKVACALLFLGIVERRDARKAPPVFMLDDDGAADFDLSETARAAFFVEDEEGQLAPGPRQTPSMPEPSLPTSRAAPRAPEAMPARRRVATPPEESHEDASASAEKEAPPPAPFAGQSKGVVGLPAEPSGARNSSEERFPSFISLGPVAPTAPNNSLSSVLDVILDAKKQEGPLEPLERPELVWSARREKPTISGPRTARSHRTVWLSVAGAGVLAGLGVVAWLFVLPKLNGSGAVAGQHPPPSAPSPVAAATAAPPKTAPVAGWSPAPPLPTPAAPSPIPAVIASPASRSSAPPSPAPRSSEPTGSLDKARRLLRGGSFPEAAQSFVGAVKGAPRGTLTVQLFVACSPETVQKAADAVESMEFYILPTNYQGRSCFRLCWGLYEQESRASAAMRSLPEYFRKGGAAPRVVPASSLLP
jgi:hypothetical protein